MSGFASSWARVALGLALVLGPCTTRAAPGDSCTLDRHCGIGLGCHVPDQRCATVAEFARIQGQDRRRDLAFVIPVTILGAGLVTVGGVFAARDNVPVAAVGLSVGSLLTLIGIGGATAIGIKRARHRARLLEISRRLGLR